MSKLSFRARALDASKPMPIYMAEELPDLPDYSAISRAVAPMPSGMQKEEECEHHLQRAICTGLIIPTPEVTHLTDVEAYEKIYPADYKLPRQLIHMQPFAMEQDIPDYDMDSEDEKWVGLQSRKMDLTPLQFEEMMDRLEKSSGQTVVTLNEAKMLLKEDDDLIIAVFDYWLNKRLKTQHPLLLTVKTESRHGLTPNNPYLAFRRRTEKMQTRKNRKNDETSYEKMLKLRRDLSRAVTLLEMVKRREKIKREHLHLTIEVFEKRYQAQDFSGQILAEVSALKAIRPAFAPLFTNQFGVHQNWSNKVCGKDEMIPRKEKRQYKKRKHKIDMRSGILDDSIHHSPTVNSENNRIVLADGLDPLGSSDDDNLLPCHSNSTLPRDRDDEDIADEGHFAFRRNRNNNYLPPISEGLGNWPRINKHDENMLEQKYRFALTSIRKPSPKCIGLARRRLGRGGRVVLDRYSNDLDAIWSSLDFTIHEPKQDVGPSSCTTNDINKDWLHFRPKTPQLLEHSHSEESSDDEPETRKDNSRPQPFSYPFPSEATSICIDIEPDQTDDVPPFSSEFNISDYFSTDNLPDFDFAFEARNKIELPDNNNWQSDELGCSRFLILPEVENLFAPSIRPQFSDTVNNVTISNCSSMSSSLEIDNQLISANFSMSTQCTSVDVEIQSNKQFKQNRQLLNDNNVASMLSKSLIGPTHNSNNIGNVHLLSATGTSCSSDSITNIDNGHHDCSIDLAHHIKNLPNNMHVINNQSTIFVSQKHSSSNLLPGYSKFTSLARQQQQFQNQVQETLKPGEMTLNQNR
ncbi:enhancer of polycomb homolog 1 [Phymastichus coffea]|uniref:enhancer of polycomb homolog 1 n=1 Tax=Phymastichus coffea TaxID=108790 RepID=UPI00273B65D0|nr:enhancer of polycomb homolog 1 [Phymastichus coffea]